jgi:DNA-directed RNA polymerase alpha subunit
MKCTFEFDSWEELSSFLSSKKLPITSGTPIENSGLGIRASNCLRAEGFKFMEETAGMSAAHLLRLPNVGRTTVDEILAWHAKQRQ